MAWFVLTRWLLLVVCSISCYIHVHTCADILHQTSHHAPPKSLLHFVAQALMPPCPTSAPFPAASTMPHAPAPLVAVSVQVNCASASGVPIVVVTLPSGMAPASTEQGGRAPASSEQGGRAPASTDPAADTPAPTAQTTPDAEAESPSPEDAPLPQKVFVTKRIRAKGQGAYHKAADCKWLNGSRRLETDLATIPVDQLPVQYSSLRPCYYCTREPRKGGFQSNEA